MVEDDPRNSSSWKSVRRGILERDGCECQDCGRAVGARDNSDVRDAEVHHKTPVADGGTNDPENLVALCSVCHTGRYWDGREPTRCGECGRVFASAHGLKVHKTHPNIVCEGDEDVEKDS